MRTAYNRVAARRLARRDRQLAPLAAWQARKFNAAKVTLLDADFDGDPQLPPTAAEHHQLEQWLRRGRPTTF
jgi:hypothetical protein